MLFHHFDLVMNIIVCTASGERFGGGSVMVWAGICQDGRTRLKIVQGTLNAVKYTNGILDSIVLPFL
jgi:hypothetical protein